MNIKKHIPNALTCGNLFCGCLAIVSAFNDNLFWSSYFIGIAAILDFFDGFTARLLKVSSPIGKELDSLADCVTFGVVPGIIMFKLLTSTLLINYQFSNTISYLLPYIAFIIPVSSALRLAKFNIDTRQTASFIGVPTPANAILIGSFPLIETNIISNVYFLAMLTITMSYLLIAELPLFALKFKDFTWQNNKIRWLFLISAVLCLLILKIKGVPFTIVLYIIFSVINNLITKDKTSIS